MPISRTAIAMQNVTTSTQYAAESPATLISRPPIAGPAIIANVPNVDCSANALGRSSSWISSGNSERVTGNVTAAIALVAAIGALKGRLHGGANEKVVDLIRADLADGKIACGTQTTRRTDVLRVCFQPFEGRVWICGPNDLRAAPRARRSAG